MKILPPKMPPRQFVSLCNQSALSAREIASRSGRHHSVVARVRRSISQQKIDFEKLDAMRDSEIWASVAGKRGRQKGTFIEPDYLPIIKKIASKKFLRDELYCEYIEEFKGEALMSLRTFYRRLNRFCASPKVTMRLSHNPGEVMQSDFTGAKCEYSESEQRQIKREMYVSTVGVSGLIFLKSTADQKTNSWIKVYNDALEFYGGVPPIWIMDNLKAAVIKNNAQGLVLNPVFEAMGHHYSASIQPARPIKPQDKAKVEAAVKLVQRAVRRVLRRIMPRSISELDWLLEKVADAINNRAVRSKNGASRREIFEEIDRPALALLPNCLFHVQSIRRNVLVTADYRITEAQVTYSVPYNLVGERVTLLLSDTHVTCIYDGQQVAIHQKGTAACQDFVQIEHMPEAHREYQKDPLESLNELAETLGPFATKFSAAAVGASPTPAGGQVIARKLRSLFRSLPPADVENACEYALANGIQSRDGIQNVLKSRFWTTISAPYSEAPQPLTHQNIRGEAYYQARRKPNNQGGTI